MKIERKRAFLNKKWRNIEKLGITRPKDSEENKERARQAHVPRFVDGSNPKK